MNYEHINLRGPQRPVEMSSAHHRPINVVFLTSIRDVGLCDRNGIVIETREGRAYMEGAIERVVRETRPGGRLNGRVDVVGVVTDDLPKDLRGSNYGALPKEGGDWIFPHDLMLSSGRLLRDFTFNIPSSFRALPLDAVEERQSRKRIFESEVSILAHLLEADVIVSDHYMARIDHLHSDLGWDGRVLNIHPAITDPKSPFRAPGKTPTADAIARAQNGLLTRTGATLHFVNDEIDAGPIIVDIDQTPVYADDEPQWLRYRNYQMGKLPVIVYGLRHYVDNIYPETIEFGARVVEQMQHAQRQI